MTFGMAMQFFLALVFWAPIFLALELIINTPTGTVFTCNFIVKRHSRNRQFDSLKVEDDIITGFPRHWAANAAASRRRLMKSVLISHQPLWDEIKMSRHIMHQWDCSELLRDIVYMTRRYMTPWSGTNCSSAKQFTNTKFNQKWNKENNWVIHQRDGT